MYSARAFDGRKHGIGLAVVILVHLAVFSAFASYAPVQRVVHRAVPLMVSIVTPPPVEKPVVVPKTPVARTVKTLPQREVVEAPPALAALAPVMPTVIEVPRGERLLSVEIAQEPAASQPKPSTPMPVTPPNFNAAYLDNPPPAYPAIAKRAGEQGKVVLRVLVSEDGSARSIELRTSSGYSRLDHAALETVKRWRFVPARQGDQVVAAWVLVPINFSLES